MQLPLALCIGSPPGIPRRRDKQFFGSVWHLRLITRHIEPLLRLAAVRLDLPGQRVAYRSGAFDLTPHAGRYLQFLRKGLIKPFGGQACRNGLLQKASMQYEGVVAANDSELGHGNKTTMQKKIVAGVDETVKTIYYSTIRKLNAAIPVASRKQDKH